VNDEMGKISNCGLTEIPGLYSYAAMEDHISEIGALTGKILVFFMIQCENDG
jgi:hypothetical protein